MAKIKEIGKVVTGKTPSTQNEDFWNGNIPFITPTDLLGIAEVKNTERHISEEGLKSIKNNSISGVSVLVGCIGSDMGNVAYTEQTCATNQQINAITDINKTINPLFIYYYLSNKKALFQQLAGKTTTPILSKSDFEEIEIPIPIKETQDNIVSILSAIDDKIANNNAICAELEAMAKLLYDYWFVQFDFPDENGKPYKSSGGKMVWSEELKREIPEGWEVKSLFDSADVSYGFPLSTDMFSGSASTPVVRIRDILENSVSAFTSECVQDKYYTKEKDLLIGMDGNFHMNFWHRDGDCVNQRIFRIRDNGQASCLQIYFEIMPHIKKKEQTVARSTVGHLSDKDLKELRILISGNETVHSVFNTVLEKICSSKKENRQLASLRDFLLPLLMNGQVVINSDE